MKKEKSRRGNINMKETYILNIYRRERGQPSNIIGTLEEISTGKRSSFSEDSELIELIRKGMMNDD